MNNFLIEIHHLFPKNEEHRVRIWFAYYINILVTVYYTLG